MFRNHALQLHSYPSDPCLNVGENQSNWWPNILSFLQTSSWGVCKRHDPHSDCVSKHCLVWNCGRKWVGRMLPFIKPRPRWCYDMACEFVYFESKLDHIFREQIHNPVAESQWQVADLRNKKIQKMATTYIIISKHKYYHFVNKYTTQWPSRSGRWPI